MNTILDQEIDMAGKIRVRVEDSDGESYIFKFDQEPSLEEINELILKIKENANPS